MLDRARDRYPWRRMQRQFPFTEAGVGAAVKNAMEMRCVKATIVPDDKLTRTDKDPQNQRSSM